MVLLVKHIYSKIVSKKYDDVTNYAAWRYACFRKAFGKKRRKIKRLWRFSSVLHVPPGEIHHSTLSLIEEGKF